MKRIGQILAIVVVAGLCGSSQAQDLRVKSWRVLTQQGGRLSWSDQRSLIVFDREGGDGFYDIWTMRLDGGGEVCLTCNATALPNLNRGNPDWHPSGEFIAFQAQYQAGQGPNGNNFGRPGVGINNDVYVMNAGGTSYWRLTNQAMGVLHVHFSHDGTKLLWAERVDASPLPSGTWVMRLADFSVSGGTPRLTNVRTLEPGPGRRFFETHGFSKDDKRVLFTANLEPGQTQDGIDEYWMDIATGAVTNLTRTLNDWDEHANLHPSGDKILYMSNSRASLVGGAPTFEYWIMDVDGTTRYRVTWLNDPRSADFQTAGVTTADSSWVGNGLQLIAYLIDGGADELGKTGRIALIEFEPAAATANSGNFFRLFMAPESILSVFGQNLATGTASAEGANLPSSLSGTTVTVTDAKSASRPAQLFLASPSQVNFLMPPGVAPGPAVITIRSGDGTETRSSTTVEAVGPSIYTANARGDGAASAYFRRFSGNTQTEFRLAYDCPGGAGTCVPVVFPFGGPDERIYLTLYGTGLRGAADLINVFLGGKSIPVTYAGSQGFYPGLDQIDIEIPRSEAGAGVQNLYLIVNGVLTNTVQVAF